MTIEQAIKKLQKLDKDLEIYTDCPKCGQANQIRKLDLVVVIRTDDKEEEIE